MKINPSAGLDAQLRNIQKLESRLAAPAATEHAPVDADSVARSFKNVFDQAAASESVAAHSAASFEAGTETDIAKVIMARQTASLAFEASLQVRNKLLAAYKEIMSMPV